MTEHATIANHNGDPVCLCGFDPATSRRVGDPRTGVWQAVRIVGAHVADSLPTAAAAPKTPTRSPIDPFQASAELKYPRAGVRRTEDGRWLLSCWDGDRIVHVIDEPVFDDRVKAFDYGYLTIGACRQSGTNLNGWATT